jgi:endonuclease/exonuclease/phosphatase family metal-dependent hydrolase
MTLTFATWNLLEGGLDAAGIDTRLRRQLAVLAALQPLHLVSTHLAPSSPSIRLAEAEAFGLLAGDEPVIAGGDWKCRARRRSRANCGCGAAAAQARSERRHRAGRGRIPRCRRPCRGPTPTVGHFGPDKLAYRCDRLYTTLPAETITGYRVLTEVDAESDHRPVIAAFDLTKAADYACLPASDDRNGRGGAASA